MPSVTCETAVGCMVLCPSQMPRSTAFTQQNQTAGAKHRTESAARGLCSSSVQNGSAVRNSSRLNRIPPSPNIRMASDAVRSAVCGSFFASACAVSAETAVLMPVTDSANTGRNRP